MAAAQSQARMRSTTDTHTGKPFRWNSTVVVSGTVVPARLTSRTHVWLHPDRVRPELLRELNDGT